MHLFVQEPNVKTQNKPGRRSRLQPGRDEQQNLETGEVENEDGLTTGVNDTKLTDTSLYWPRNRESASCSKTADSNSLFPFEKERR